MSDFDAERLKRMEQAMLTCTMCGFCKSVCPSFKEAGWDTSAARGRVILAYGLAQGDLEPDQDVLDSLYTCTTCMDCYRRCPSKVDVVGIVEDARKDIVASGRMLPKHAEVVSKVRSDGNPYGEKASVPDTLGAEPRNAPLAYFAGCTATYRSKSISQATLSILRKLNEDFTVLDERCCGSVMGRIGCPEDELVPMMARNVEHIASLGVETLILSCAGCYRMFKEDYPSHVDVPFRVLHVSEWLAEKDLPLRSCGKRITYHDPCHLGRHAGVYEAPRQVIKKIPGATLVEMANNRDQSRCCGGGGGVRSAFPDVAKNMASARLEEMDADILVTSCPFCVTNLKSANADEIPILDLTELVDRLL